MNRRASLKQDRQDRVREEILDASRAVLLSEGFAGLTLAAVARELDLTKAALYYYFPSKEAIVFELIYLSLESHARVVGDAIAIATSGAEALEALIRTAAADYGGRMDELRLAYLVPQVATAGGARLRPELIARIRPFNDIIFGGVAGKIGVDQRAGRIDDSIDARRLAFLAHTSVLGILTVEGLVAVVDDAPLIHSRQALVDELVRTFTARLKSEKPKKRAR